MADVTADRINDFWNQVVQHVDAPAGRLDAELTESIGRFHTLASAPTPGSARERARQRVFDDLKRQENTMSAIAPVIPFPSSGWGSTQDRSSRRPERSSRRGDRRRLLASIAAALLLVLSGLGGYVTWFGNEPARPTFIPAVIQPDEGSPASESSLDVPTRRGNLARTAEMPGPGPMSNPVELWSVQLEGENFSAPLLVGDTIVIGADGTVLGLSAGTGDELWRFDTGGTSTAVDSDGSIAAVSSDVGVFVIDLATGDEWWSVPTSVSWSSAFVDAGTVYFGSTDGAFLALDVASGDEIWRVEMDAPVVRFPAFDGETIYFGTDDSTLRAIAADTGAELWTFQLDTDGLVWTPVVVDGVVYQATEEWQFNTYYALDAATGEEIWRLEDGNGRRLGAVSDGMVYMGSELGRVFAVDAANGEERWSYQTGAVVGSAPVVAGSVLYVTNRAGNVVALDAATGAEIWQTQAGNPIENQPVVSGGVAYVVTMSGRLVALVDGEPLVASPEATAAPPDGAAHLMWESIGSDENPLVRPVAVGVDPQGKTYVVEPGANQIIVLDADGQYIESWGEPGAGPGQFQFRLDDTYDGAIDFDAEGNAYVFDFNNFRVQKLDPDGNFLLEWGGLGQENGQFGYVLGSVDRENGLVYTVDFYSNRVQVFDLDGSFLDKWGSEGSGNGQFLAPTAIAAGPDGTVYVADLSNRIQAFDQHGTFLFTFGESGGGPGQLSEPYGIAIDANGNLYVGDRGNGRVQMFHADGTYLGELTEIPGAGALAAPGSVRLDGDGFLYIADEANHRVLKVQVPAID